jgi:expansin (peptidoglycan-binding protein)
MQPVRSLLLLTALLTGGCSDKSVTVKEPAPLQCPTAPIIHSGEATFYTFASGAGACMFDSTPNDLMIGAMNSIDYAGSAECGACVRVTGQRGTILIRIVDLCPECPQGHIDLSPLAFSYLADTSVGRIPITWEVVDCSAPGPIVYHFKDGSNQWWTAVQIRNHRYPIHSLEYLTSERTFKSVQRTGYNYFVEPSGMGPGPYVFRVTDIYGHVLVDSAIAHVENGNVPGHAQFNSCLP